MKQIPKAKALILENSYFSIVAFGIICGVLSYLIGPDRYTQRIILLFILWAGATSSFNIISGYGGQTVFGFMMFIGTGAYTSVLLFKFFALSPWIGIFLGAFAAVIIAFFIGLPTLRLHGAFFAVATVAFPLITNALLSNFGFEEIAIPFSGLGFKAMYFEDIRSYVLLALIVLCGILVLIRKIEKSRFGFSLKALKQNEVAAEAAGVDTFETKLTAFILSAGLGAIIGTIYAFSVLFVLTVHSVFGLFIIVRILAIGCVGGLGTLWGPVIAAGILVPTVEFLNSKFGGTFSGAQDIIYGAALIGAIIYMPEGIWGKITNALRSAVKKNALNENDLKKAINKESILLKTSLKNNIPKPNAFNNFTLRLENISKSFGGVKALENVSIKFPTDKVIGIIGPNGSGKTTLFNVIHGYLKPDKGAIFFEGKNVTNLKPHDLCKLGIGRTFQVPQIFPEMTIFENITVGAFAKEKDSKAALKIAHAAAESLNFSCNFDQPAVGLTAWESKMIEFSRALSTVPKLLLLDEPMAGLNREESVHIGEIIRKIAKYGITVLVIEHVVQTLSKISDYMVALDQGAKIIEGTPERVISDPHIVEAYLGCKWRERYAKS